MKSSAAQGAHHGVFVAVFLHEGDFLLHLRVLSRQLLDEGQEIF